MSASSHGHASGGGARKTLIVLLMVGGMVLIHRFAAQTTAFNPTAMLALGFVILAGYAFGQLVEKIALPHITGYLIAGLALGPSTAHLLPTSWQAPPFDQGILSASVIEQLSPLETLAVALIALTAGGELKIASLRKGIASILGVLGGQIVSILGLVTLFVIALSGILPQITLPGLGPVDLTGAAALGAVVGSISIATSPSATIAVINDVKARGPTTSTVLATVVLKDVVVVILFAVLSTLAMQALGGGGTDQRLGPYLLKHIGGALALGAIIGFGMALYLRYVKAEVLLFLVGAVYTAAFLASQLDVEFVILFITAGFVTANFSTEGDHMLETVETLSMPVYVVFFTLAGAKLHLDQLSQLAPFAVALVSVRALGIWMGTALGGRLGGAAAPLRKHGWLGFISQAGVTISLATIVGRRMGEPGQALATLIIAGIAINELIGPVLLKVGLGVVGETAAKRAKKQDEAAAPVTERSPEAAEASGVLAAWPTPDRGADAWGPPLSTSSHELDALGRELQLDLAHAARDVAEEPLTQFREDALGFVRELRREFLRHHRRITVQALDEGTELHAAEALRLEQAELAEKWRAAVLGRASRVQQYPGWDPGPIVAAVDAIVEGLPAELQAPYEDRSFEHRDDDSVGASAARTWLRARRGGRRLFGETMAPRTVEPRALARYHLWGKLPERLEPVAALYAQAESHLVERTRSIFDGLVIAYDELASDVEAARRAVKEAGADGAGARAPGAAEGAPSDAAGSEATPPQAAPSEASPPGEPAPPPQAAPAPPPQAAPAPPPQAAPAPPPQAAPAPWGTREPAAGEEPREARPAEEGELTGFAAVEAHAERGRAPGGGEPEPDPRPAPEAADASTTSVLSQESLQERLAAVRAQVDEELMLAVQEVDRIAEDLALRTSLAMGSCLRDLKEDLPIAATPDLPMRRRAASKLYKKRGESLSWLERGTAAARQAAAALYNRLALEMELHALEGRVKDALEDHATALGRDVRGRTHRQVQRVRQALAQAQERLEAALETDSTAELAREIRAVSEPVARVSAEAARVATRLRDQLADESSVTPVLDALTRSAQGLTDRYRVPAGPIPRAEHRLPPQVGTVEVPFRDWVLARIETSLAPRLLSSTREVAQKVEPLAQALSELERRIAFNVELAINELSVVEDDSPPAATRQLVREMIGGALARNLELFRGYSEGSERWGDEVRITVREAVLGGLDELRGGLVDGEVGRMRSQMVRDVRGRRLSRVAAELHRSLRRSTTILRHAMRDAMGPERLDRFRTVIGLPEWTLDDEEVPDAAFEPRAPRASIPMVYRRLFSAQALEAGDILTGRDEALERALRLLEGTGEGRLRTVAVVGPDGVGKSAFVNAVVRAKRWPKVRELELDEPASVAQVDALFDPASEGHLVVVSGVHWLRSLRPGGFEPLRRFVAGVVRDGGRNAFLVRADRLVWAQCRDLAPIGDAFPEVVRLDPLAPDALEAAVLARHTVSGYGLVFSQGLEPQSRIEELVMQAASPLSRPQESYFRALHAASGGLLRDALRLWLASVQEVDEAADFVHLGPVPPPRSQALRRLKKADVLTLYQVARQGWMSTEVCASLFRIDEATAEARLLALSHVGILERRGAVYRISLHLRGPVLRLLREWGYV